MKILNKVDILTRYEVEWMGKFFEDHGEVLLFETPRNIGKCATFQWREEFTDRHSVVFDSEKEAREHFENSESLWDLYNGG